MPAIAKVRYTHDAMIDEILQNPAISQNELAKFFGYSATWISIVLNSDAFQARLEERKAEIIDPRIRASIEERLEGLAKTSLDRLIDRIERNNGAQVATRDLIAIARLGVGDRNTRPAGPVQQNNLYVVALPAVAKNSTEWLESAQRNQPVLRAVPQIVEEAQILEPVAPQRPIREPLPSPRPAARNPFLD